MPVSPRHPPACSARLAAPLPLVLVCCAQIGSPRLHQRARWRSWLSILVPPIGSLSAIPEAPLGVGQHPTDPRRAIPTATELRRAAAGVMGFSGAAEGSHLVVRSCDGETPSTPKLEHNFRSLPNPWLLLRLCTRCDNTHPPTGASHFRDRSRHLSNQQTPPRACAGGSRSKKTTRPTQCAKTGRQNRCEQQTPPAWGWGPSRLGHQPAPAVQARHDGC